MTTAAAAPAHVRPPLKWAGGKRWLVPHVRRLWQDHQRRRLVEPFCGGLAMSLGLRPRRALLNDVNPHLVSFYRQLARGLTISLPMENASEAYYANRRSFNALLAAGHGHTAEAASLFYYLNRTGFNGLCRFNSRGEFNVPFGRYARIAYVRDFSAYRPAFAALGVLERRLRGAALEAGRLRLRRSRRTTSRSRSTPGRGSGGTTRCARPSGWPGTRGRSCCRTRPRRASWRSTGGSGYALRFLHAPRRISCTGDRTPAREVLATRNL